MEAGLAGRERAGSAPWEVLLTTFEGALDGAMLGVLDDLGRPRILHANQAFCELCGYSLAELAGRSLELLHGPGTDPAAVDGMLEAILNGRPARSELLYQRRDGSPCWVDLSVQPVGPPAARQFFSICRDVTPHRHGDQQRTLLERLLATLLGMSDVPVCVLDDRACFVLANPAFEAAFGWSEADLAGRPLDSLATGPGWDISAPPAEMALRTRDAGSVRAALRVATVPGADNRAYRIVELRPTVAADAPGQGACLGAAEFGQAAHARTQTSSPPRLVAGHLQLVGLDDIKARLGDRWPALASKVATLARRTIERRLAPDDVFTQSGETAFTICFGSLDEKAAAFKADLIAQEIREKIVGATDDPAAGRAVMDVVTVDLAGQDGSPGGVLDAISRRLAESGDAIRRNHMQILSEAMERAGLVTVPVVTGSRQPVPMVLARLDPENALKLNQVEAAFRDEERISGETDGILLFRVAEAANRDIAAATTMLYVVPVRLRTLINRQAMEGYVGICRSLAPPVRQRMFLEITDIPADIAHARLEQFANMLRLFCRGVVLQLRRLDHRRVDFTRYRPALISWDWRGVDRVEPGEWGEIRKSIEMFHLHKCRALVTHVPGPAVAASLHSVGCDLLTLSGDRHHG